MGHLVVFVLFLSLVVGLINASIIKFQASPNPIKTNLTTSASMRCSLADTDIANGQIGKRTTTNTTDDVTRISSITIRRNNGEEVVFATPFDQPTALVDLGSLEVKGDVSGTSSEGYVELMWKDPSKMALGEYVCEIGTFEAGHHTLVFTSTLEMSTITPSIDDLVTEFKAITQRQQQRIDDQDIEMHKQRQDIANQKQEISTLQTRLNSQNSTVNKLTLCTSSRVSFMAVISQSGQSLFSGINQVVVFDKKVSVDNASYNEQTGKFVCSRPGTYYFSAHAVSNRATGVCLHLNVNSQSITSLFAYENTHIGASSTSAVIHLKSGDEVYIKTAECNGGANLFKDGNAYQANVFTGHMLHADDCLV